MSTATDFGLNRDSMFAMPPPPALQPAPQFIKSFDEVSAELRTPIEGIKSKDSIIGASMTVVGDFFDHMRQRPSYEEPAQRVPRPAPILGL